MRAVGLCTSRNSRGLLPSRLRAHVTKVCDANLSSDSHLDCHSLLSVSLRYLPEGGFTGGARSRLRTRAHFGSCIINAIHSQNAASLPSPTIYCVLTHFAQDDYLLFVGCFFFHFHLVNRNCQFVKNTHIRAVHAFFGRTVNFFSFCGG